MRGSVPPLIGMGFVFSLVLASACGSEAAKRTKILLEDYDTTCTAPTDCTAASVGSYCPCTPCANAAINVSDLAKYHADVSEIDCGKSNVHCAPCPEIPPTDCVDGRCELVK